MDQPWYNKSMRIVMAFLSIFILSGAAIPEIKPDIYKPLVVSGKRVTVPGKQVRIVVIDTGFDSNYAPFANLCPDGHKSFLEVMYPMRDPDSKEPPQYEPWDQDTHGHGTNIVGLLAKYARADYCVMIYRYYSPTTKNAKASTLAWQAAADSDADIIVYSGGGLSQIPEEKAAVKKSLLRGKIIFAAAGNEMHDLDGSCNYYPACYYKRIIVVGNLKDNDTLQESSNYGKCVDFYAHGVNAEAFGRIQTGTSQANAIVAGELISEVFKEKNVKGYRSPLLVSAHPKVKARKLVGKHGKKNGRH